MTTEMTLSNGMVLRVGDTWTIAKTLAKRKIHKLCAEGCAWSDQPHAHTDNGYSYFSRWEDGTYLLTSQPESTDEIAVGSKWVLKDPKCRGQVQGGGATVLNFGVR